MTPRPIRSSSAAGTWRDESVEVSGAAPLALRVYGCAERCAGMPLVLHFHAGAFVAGGLDEGAAVAGLLVDAGAAVASLAYPLAPEHPFPQAIEAGYAALQWLERQRRRLAVTRAPLFVAGEEAGGNLAAAVAMMARDRAGPELAGQILLSPMLDVCVGTASQRDAKAGPVGCRWADGWRAYLARGADALHPYAAPGSAQRLAGLPPTLLASAADDPLRDETLAFAARLRDAGVPATLALIDGATGWPRSYQAGTPGPWAASLGRHLNRFLQHTTTTTGSTA
ncbi:MAG: alpha/beta hydrolase [Piscinibacter sp.]